MNADVEKAVERAGRHTDFSRPLLAADWSAIRQHLRDQEAEIARLRDVVMRKEGELSTAWIRAALGDALLQEAHPFVPVTYSSSGRPQLHDRITAHLGGEHE